MTINKMKKKFSELTWNAIMHDTNTHKFETFNVLREDLLSDIIRLQKQSQKSGIPLTYEAIKGCINGWGHYHYWSKFEYEVVLEDMFERDEKKIDVWEQLEMNLDRLTEYLIRELEIDTLALSSCRKM